MASPDQTSITVDLGVRGGQVSFQSEATLLNWLETNMHLYVPMWQEGSLSSVRSGRDKAFSRARSALGVQHALVNSREQVLNAVIHASRYVVLADSLPGALIQALLAKHPASAAGAYGHFTGLWTATPTEDHAFEGRMRAIMLEGGVGQIEVSKNAADNLCDDIRKWFDVSKQELASVTQSCLDTKTTIEQFRESSVQKQEADKAQINADLDVIRRQGTGHINELKIECEKTLAQVTEDWKAIKETFAAKLSLQEPVVYWRDKKVLHYWAAGIYGVAFVAALFFLGWFLLDQIQTQLGVGESTGGADAGAKATGIPWRGLGYSLILTTFAFWFIRAIARLFFSNIHLATDCAERAVMTETYLSLMQGGAAFKDEDKRIVLEALFRRTSTGIVRDDANPPVMLAHVMKSKE